MITIGEDKKALKKYIAADKYIMGVVKNEDNIETTRYGTDILDSADSSVRIFISTAPSMRTVAWQQKAIIYRITVVGKRSLSATVDAVAYQLVALFGAGDFAVNPCAILELDSAPLELDSDPALYAVETQFRCYETIFNKKRI